MALEHAPHHLGLAVGAERRAAALAGLDGDEPLDDAAALDQQGVHAGIDPVDIDAEVGEQFGGGLLGHCLGAIVGLVLRPRAFRAVIPIDASASGRNQRRPGFRARLRRPGTTAPRIGGVSSGMVPRVNSRLERSWQRLKAVLASRPDYGGPESERGRPERAAPDIVRLRCPT